MADQTNTIPSKKLQYPLKWYAIKNWRQFQHYKHRNPPWIKLHCQMVRSETWFELDEPSRLLMLTCMMIAPENDGKVPANPSILKRLGSFRKMPNLKPLIDVGFLIEVLADDSNLQADASKVLARVETETETETEKKVSIERVAPLPPPQAKKGTSEKRKLGSRLPENWQPSEVGIGDAVARWGHTGAQEELENFRDYWLAIPGSKGLKLDWDRTWRRWCRNSHRGKSNGNGFHREKSAKEKYGDLLQSLGRGEASSDVVGQLPKLYPK